MIISYTYTAGHPSFHQLPTTDEDSGNGGSGGESGASGGGGIYGFLRRRLLPSKSTPVLNNGGSNVVDFVALQEQRRAAHVQVRTMNARCTQC